MFVQKFPKSAINVDSSQDKSYPLLNRKPNFFHQGLNGQSYSYVGVFEVKIIDICKNRFDCLNTLKTLKFYILSVFQMKNLKNRWLDFLHQDRGLMFYFFGGLLDLKVFDFDLCVRFLIVPEKENAPDFDKSLSSNSCFSNCRLDFYSTVVSISISFILEEYWK